MGSLCGSNTQTTSTASTTTPTNQAGLQSVFNQVQAAAQNPYTPYGGELTAPVNSQQTAGIAGVNSNANTAQPYYQTAANYATASGAPISASAIQGYENPYTQSVIKATQANFDESNGQQQQQVKGNAALSGALGGDRQAVAQAETARQQNLSQAPVIAGLNQQNYTQALQAAQADRSAAGSAAGTFGNLGTAAQTAGLQGAGAQINAGTLQQTTQQAQDTAAQQQYLQKQAFPYQNAQFLAQYGTPAALAQGSSTNGTQTAPGPNQFAQLAGLGVSAAGLFLKDGGAVPAYADGGASPFNFITDTHGYVPVGSAPQIAVPQSQAPQFKTAAAPVDPWAPVSASMGKLKGSLSDVFTPSSDGGYGATSTDASGVGGIGGLYERGGLVHAIHEIHRTIKRARGGAVDSMPFRAFADGGDTTFDDRFSAAYQSPSRGIDTPASDEPFRLAGPEAMDAWRKGVDQPNPALVADAGQPGPDGSAPNPMAFAGKPDTAPAVAAINRAAPQQDPEAEPSSAMAYDAGNPMKIIPAAQDAAAAPEQHFGKSLFGVNLSDKTRQALVAAGLGMMASKSPFALSAIGEGGLKGLNAYSEAGKAEQEAADKKITQAQAQKRVEFEAQRIAQSASQFAKTNSLAERKFKSDEETGKYVPAGSIVNGDTIHPAVMDGRTGKIIDAVTGEPPKVDDKIEAKGTKAPISDEDAKDIAKRYVDTGDRTHLQGLGMTGSNKAKVNHFISEYQKEQGLSNQDLGSRVAEWEGRKAGQRVLGTQEAKMGSAAFEAEGAIKQARGVIEKLPRTSFLPINKLIEGYQNNTLNPDQTELYGRTQAIVNTYAAVMARGANVTTDSSRHHAQELLKTAGDAATYNRMLDTMLSEIDMAKKSPEKMREFYRQQYGSKAFEGATNPDSTSSAAVPVAPKGVPAGSAYSPSRKQWKAPDGSIYNADGSKT